MPPDSATLSALCRSTTRHAILLLILGAANDRRQRPLRLIDGALQILQFLFHQQPGHAGLQGIRSRPAVEHGPGGGAKGIIHIDIGQGGQLGGEARTFSLPHEEGARSPSSSTSPSARAATLVRRQGPMQLSVLSTACPAASLSGARHPRVSRYSASFT